MDNKFLIAQAGNVLRDLLKIQKGLDDFGAAIQCFIDAVAEVKETGTIGEQTERAASVIEMIKLDALLDINKVLMSAMGLLALASSGDFS